MTCNCIERVNAKLKDAGRGYELAPLLTFDEKMRMKVRLSVPTRWTGEPPRGKKKQQPPTMICTYCPFCGQKTVDEAV